MQQSGARHELMLILDGFGFIEEGGLELDSFTGCARCKGGAASMGLETSPAGRDGLERPLRDVQQKDRERWTRCLRYSQQLWMNLTVLHDGQ